MLHTIKQFATFMSGAIVLGGSLILVGCNKDQGPAATTPPPLKKATPEELKATKNRFLKEDQAVDK